MTKKRLMIYGAYGYTGKLVAQATVDLGLNPILAGRDRVQLMPLADKMNLEARVVSLEDTAALNDALSDCAAVLHCAGPYIFTSAPMVTACLATGTHYLDITGEIPVIEACARLDAKARKAGITILPAVGFDVVPTDCVAAMLAEKMPDATSLTLAFGGMDSMSRGTTRTGMLFLTVPVMVRRGGKLVPRQGDMTTMVDFGEGPRKAYATSWGDVTTAFHTTGIPSIEVFIHPSKDTEAFFRMPMFAKRFLASPIGAWILRARLRSMPDGPDENARETGRTYVYGRVENAKGEVREMRLQAIEGYALTGLTAARIAQAVLQGQVEAGFQTPARAMGGDFILSLNGCKLIN